MEISQLLQSSVLLILAHLLQGALTQQCRSETSILGWMLQGHIFKTMQADRPHACVFACYKDDRCQSLNWVISLLTCEFNNRTKEARPEDFIPNADRSYFKRESDRVPLGSIAELPAATCDEIKNSEGKAPSGNYWLSAINSSMPVLTYCNLEERSCSDIKAQNPQATSGSYVIDPDGDGGNEPFTVFCDMADKNGVGVTVVGHDSEARTLVDGYEGPGSYVKYITYNATGLTGVAQLAGLADVSDHCEQFIKYECYGALLFRDGECWWVSRDNEKMIYWGGARPDDFKKCACGVTSPNSCVDPNYRCNCEMNDATWREDSGLLTEKSQLPVMELRFGDTGDLSERGYHTLGKLKCYSTRFLFGEEKFQGKILKLERSCSDIKAQNPQATSGSYVIDPDGDGGNEPFTVFCDMADKNGVGVTVVGHDSEARTLVDGYEGPGSYVKYITYTSTGLTGVAQLAGLADASAHCEQFIKYECYGALLFRDGECWWVSRDNEKMIYWGGAKPGDYKKCACGVTSPNSCADPNYGCNCEMNDATWREDSGLLTEKSQLPVMELRFGDTGGSPEKGYHTLGKFKCYG